MRFFVYQKALMPIFCTIFDYIITVVNSKHAQKNTEDLFFDISKDFRYIYYKSDSDLVSLIQSMHIKIL